MVDRYNFSDYKAQATRLQITLSLNPSALATALTKLEKRIRKHLGLLNKYSKPHQSARECARRVKQRSLHG